MPKLLLETLYLPEFGTLLEAKLEAKTPKLLAMKRTFTAEAQLWAAGQR